MSKNYAKWEMKNENNSHFLYAIGKILHYKSYVFHMNPTDVSLFVKL